jgi:hypothetical protein
MPGDAIQAPINPASANYTVRIPVSKSTEVPLVNVAKAISYKSSGLAALKPINSKLISSTPITLNKGAYLGGLSTAQQGKTPVATINRSYNEVQTTAGVPTTVLVSGLSKKVNAVIRYYTTSGSPRELGTLKVSSAGSIILPPLTLTEIGQVLTLQISAGKITRILLLRVTR